MIHLVMRVPIYLNFTSKAESFVYTRCGILKKVKKPGLVKETLGKLWDLTLERL
jgi:hypothetical protein